jgi:hypothetical protein
VGRDGRTYQIRARRGRTTLFDDGVANGLLNIRVVDVETKFEAATLKLDVQGGQITIDRADAHGVGEGQGLIVVVLRRIREASPRGTRIHLASAEKKTNLVLDRIMADIVNSETYRNLLPEKQDPWNPPQGGLAEKFLFEEFNRRANIEEAGRLPKKYCEVRDGMGLSWRLFFARGMSSLMRSSHKTSHGAEERT